MSAVCTSRAVVCPHTARDMGTCRLLQLSEVVLGSGSGASHWSSLSTVSKSVRKPATHQPRTTPALCIQHTLPALKIASPSGDSTVVPLKWTGCPESSGPTTRNLLSSLTSGLLRHHASWDSTKSHSISLSSSRTSYAAHQYKVLGHYSECMVYSTTRATNYELTSATPSRGPLKNNFQSTGSAAWTFEGRLGVV